MRLGASARQFQNRDEAVAYYRPFSDALATVPGVISRGAVNVLPFTSAIGWGQINVEGWTPQPGQELQVDQRGATPEYFKTMRIPVVIGRVFLDSDMPQNAELVCIIDEKFAQRFWPNGDAIGKHLWTDPKRQMTIVGVVRTVKQYGLDIDGRLVAYRPSPNGTWHVAGTSARSGNGRQGHDAQGARTGHPTITISDVQTMSDRMSQSMARQRFFDSDARRVFGVAMVLAIVGVYGVMSHLVTQGAHDIGVRMALGAERNRILLMVLRQGLELTAAGVVLVARGCRIDARHGEPAVQYQHD